MRRQLAGGLLQVRLTARPDTNLRPERAPRLALQMTRGAVVETAPNERASTLYRHIVEKSTRKSFDNVNNHRWSDAVKDLSPHVLHRVSGLHALGGERRGMQAVLRWFERLGRVFPILRISIERVWVTGWPSKTTVFVTWHAYETLLNRLLKKSSP